MRVPHPPKWPQLPPQGVSEEERIRYLADRLREQAQWMDQVYLTFIAAAASHAHVPADISPQGAGSGLDADKLDGSEASAFAAESHTHAAGDVTSGTFADARISPQSVIQHRVAIGRFLDSSADVLVGLSEAVYWGDEATDGSWRMIRSGNDLLVERREAAIWVTKHTFTP